MKATLLERRNLSYRLYHLQKWQMSYNHPGLEPHIYMQGSYRDTVRPKVNDGQQWSSGHVHMICIWF